MSTTLSVALNGSRKRDLQIYAGDEATIVLVVYAEDGDTVPVTVTDARITTCWPSAGTFTVGSQFTVPDDCCGRLNYRLIGEIAGVTTTVAYGVLTIRGGAPCCYGRWDYGGPWGWAWP